MASSRGGGCGDRDRAGRERGLRPQSTPPCGQARATRGRGRPRRQARGAPRSSGGINGGAGAGGSTAGEPAGDFGAASAYVGVSKAKLRKELSAGRSLAAVAATTPGHSALGLLEAIMRPRVRRIEAQVAAKRLSKAKPSAASSASASASRRGWPARRRTSPRLRSPGQYLGLSPDRATRQAARRPHALAAGGWDPGQVRQGARCGGHGRADQRTRARRRRNLASDAASRKRSPACAGSAGPAWKSSAPSPPFLWPRPADGGPGRPTRAPASNVGLVLSAPPGAHT